MVCSVCPFVLKDRKREGGKERGLTESHIHTGRELGISEVL